MSAPTNVDDWEEDHREDLRVMREHWQQEARAEAARRKLHEEIRTLKCVRDRSLQMLQMLQAQFTEQGTPHQFHLIR